MLKAVRFDLEEHSEIIEFVENYRDKKNKPNHSEAIRLLMSKGLEALNQPAEPSQPAIDLESMKADIFQQIMTQVNKMGLNQQPKPSPTITPAPNLTHGIKGPPTKPRPPVPPSQSSKTAVNPLLANILGNSER